MKNIFITGGSGFLGIELINKLLNGDYFVNALVRSDGLSKYKNNHKLKITHGNVLQDEKYKASLENVSIVYYLAGVVTDYAPKYLYFDVHVKGLKKVLDAAIFHGVKKLIYVSSCAVLDYTQNIKLNEESPYTKSSNGYRQSKVEAEDLLRTYEDKIEIVIVRPSWVYGSNDTLFLPEIITRLKDRSMTVIGSSQNFIPLVHVSNLAQFLIDIDEIESKKVQIFNVSDISIRWIDLINEIKRIIQVNKKVPVLPYTPAYCIGKILESVYRLLKIKTKPILTSSKVEMIGRSVEIDTSLVESLGYVGGKDFNNKFKQAVLHIMNR